MDTKHIHESLEKMAQYVCEECKKPKEQIDTAELGAVVDIVKDLANAEYHALIAKEMRKAHEDEEAEEKHFIKMLKEQYKDEYKEMKEQYGDEADRRFYDSWRRADGSFARKGTGEYRPKSYYRRRGYVEPMYHMPLDMYHDYTPEELRDWDRDRGRLYFTPSNTGNGGMNNTSSSQSNGNSDNTRSYSDGFNDGQTRGYSEGYERGRNDGSRNNSSRYDNARRGYSESKQNHRGNSPEDNSENMRNLEKVLNIIAEDVKEYMPNMSPSEKAMAKQKIDGISKSIQ